jgi:hypothetical protein
MTGPSDLDAWREGRSTLPEPAPASAAPQAKPKAALSDMGWLKDRRIWLVLLPIVLYAAALNPFFLPASYDDIIYHFGALSLAADGSFKFCGKYIVDWPPGLSALIAIPFRLGWQSVWTAKVCVLLCAATGLLCGFRLFQKEGRPFPALTFALFGLLPISFLMGTRTMSEWPYFLASILFLHVLRRLRTPDINLFTAVGAGLLLGASSLTKFTGVLLGAAVVTQLIQKWRQSRTTSLLRTILPELITALIGAGCFVAWKVKIQWQLATGSASPSDYYRAAGWLPHHLNEFNPFSVPEKITDLLFHTEAALGVLRLGGWTVVLAAAVPGLVVLAGLLLRLRSREGTPADWYVLSVLVMFSWIGTNQQTRYLMPVAPFLINYGLLGCRHCSKWLVRRIPWCTVWPIRLAAAGWFAVLLGAAAQLLVVGNLTGNHRGLCYWMSPTPERFYRGYWLDLYRACQIIRNDSTPGSVAIIGGDDKYVTAFTERNLVKFDPSADFVFLLVMNGTEAGREQLANSNLECLSSAGHVVLYKRNAALHSQHLTAYEKQ